MCMYNRILEIENVDDEWCKKRCKMQTSDNCVVVVYYWLLLPGCLYVVSAARYSRVVYVLSTYVIYLSLSWMLWNVGWIDWVSHNVMDRMHSLNQQATNICLPVSTIQLHCTLYIHLYVHRKRIREEIERGEAGQDLRRWIDYSNEEGITFEYRNRIYKSQKKVSK